MNAVCIVKRAIDILLGTAILVLITPFLLLIAILVKTTSKGPIFFRIRRTGGMSSKTDTNPEFYSYKFRTMMVDAKSKKGAIMSQKCNSRITLVGRFLRRTRLDELPQFINVLKGDISIVDPGTERLSRPSI